MFGLLPWYKKKGSATKQLPKKRTCHQDDEPQKAWAILLEWPMFRRLDRKMAR